MAPEIDVRADAVRGFNRFYTRQIGVLREGLLKSAFSLTEARVLYELAHRENPTARELGSDLDLDAGYLSRLIAEFERRGYVTRTPAPADARQRHVVLTAAGRRAFAPLDRRAHEEVVQLLRALPESGQARLIAAMRTIESLLTPPSPARKGYLLRAPRPGDMGWVVRAHGELYAAEHEYDQTFEALVAEIVAGFVRKFDPKLDGCWIAERDGEPVGSVFLVRKSKSVAKLRLFIVDPSARGSGIGAMLVAECIRFARQAGYRSIALWTQADLLAARHLYQRAGFRRIATERHRSFGRDLVGETWELQL
ncbi:MAG: helix-turn-helix domain-containing GNAT family N-acetyltransferase [Betaproteobacteria bacterium]